MIVQKLIILFLVTLLSIQIFPFEWVGVLLDKKTSCKNIAKLISLSSTDEEDNTENLLSNEEVKYFNDSCYTDQLVPPLRTNQHFPIYLVSHTADFYRKILIPPPNYRA